MADITRGGDIGMRLQIRLSSTVLLRPVQVTVALPDGFSWARPPYKTVWALHPAMSDGDMFFSELGMEELAQKEGFALVAPSLGNNCFVNGIHERQADFLEDELLSSLLETLPLSADRRHNALLGISMGAYGAMRWALDTPEAFNSVAAISGVFERSLPEHPMLRKQRELRALNDALLPVIGKHVLDDNGEVRPDADLQGLIERAGKKTEHAFPLVRLFCGADDYLALPHCRDMQTRLRSNGIAAELLQTPGGHNREYWRQIIPSAIRGVFTTN